MLPTPDDYRRYGKSIGRDYGEVTDWYGFTQTATYANVVMPTLRRLAGYRDTFGAGTYGEPTGWESREALDALVTGFREGAEA